MAQLMPDGAAIAHETASPWVSRAIPTTSSALPVSTSTLPHTGYRIHLTPLLDQPGTYRFAALTRELRGSGDKLFIGRDKDRSDAGGAHELLFRSKVVSHAHAEVILDGGRLFIRDTGSLHGTSLNQLRLSSARRVSKLRQLRDGDIIQLGTDRAYGVVQHDRFVRAKVKIEKIVSEQGGLSVSAAEPERSTGQAYESTEGEEMSSPDSHSSTDSVLDLPATTRPSINVKEAKVNRGDISPTAYYKIRCVPDPKAPRALQFKPLTRVLKDGDVLRIARFAENSDAGLTAANALDLDRLVFKTRVVSRTHAEVWMEDRTMFIKDIGSSSGTFLNGKRLSPAEEESEAWPLCDGDLVQLGVEYCGGILDVHKPARMRVELCETTSPSCDAFRCSSLYNSSLSLSDYDSVLNLVATVKPAAKDQCDESPKWIDCGSLFDLGVTAVPNLRNLSAITGDKNTRAAKEPGFLRRKLSMPSLLGWHRRRRHREGGSYSPSHEDEKTMTKLEPKPTEVAAARFKDRIFARLSRKELYARPVSPCTTFDESEGEVDGCVEKRSMSSSEDGIPFMDVLCFCLWCRKPARRP